MDKKQIKRNVPIRALMQKQKRTESECLRKREKEKIALAWCMFLF